MWSSSPEQALRYTGEHNVLKVEDHGLLGKKVEGEWLRQHSPLESRHCFGRLFTAALPFLSFGTGVFISFCFILEVGILIFTVVRVTKSPQLSEDADF